MNILKINSPIKFFLFYFEYLEVVLDTPKYTKEKHEEMICVFAIE